MKKYLLATLLLCSSALTLAQPNCIFIKSTTLREEPNGAVAGKITKNTRTVLLSTTIDTKGQRWAEILHGKYNKEVGFDTNVEGWVLRSTLRCK